MKTGRPPILETRCLERTGISMTEYYRQCSGKMNIYDAAKSLDVSPNTIYNWLHHNRLEWSSPTDHNREPFRFELNGYRGVSFADAIEIAVVRKNARGLVAGIKQRCRQAGVSNSNVYKIRKDYGISANDALEIAVIRKATREARHG